MLIEDDKLLKAIRQGGICLYCNRSCRQCHAHHAGKKRGQGGGSRLDVDENLACLCPSCHHRAEHDAAMNVTIRHLIARRVSNDWGCRVETEDIAAWLDLLLATPKEQPFPLPWWRTMHDCDERSPARNGDTEGGPADDHPDGIEAGREDLRKGRSVPRGADRAAPGLRYAADDSADEVETVWGAF